MPTRPQSILAAALTGLLFAGGCATDNKVISQADTQNDQLVPTIIDDAQVDGYMQKIGARIVAAAKELDALGVGPKAHTDAKDNAWMFDDVQFHMVGSDTLNAFTTGGHHVYIYSQLFTTAKTEDEFAAVCAHEFAHIYCRHVQQGMNRQYGIYAAAAATAVGGAAVGYALDSDNALTGAGAGALAGGAAGLGVGQFLGMGFTRKDEDQADQFGFQFYTHAGWDPNHFDDFFKQMIEKGYDTTPEIASDHPKLANRVTNTERRIKELPNNAAQWQRPDLIGPDEFKALQSIATRKAKAVVGTKKAAAAELMLAAFPSCVAPTATKKQLKARDVLTKATKSSD